ncbi:MAG: LptE family protein [Rikenellaceae bacterium]
MEKLKGLYRVVVAAAAMLVVGCAYQVSYSLSGASIPVAAKTFSVDYFANNAAMVAPILSSEMTEALKLYFIRRTKLVEVREGGDFAFEGEIIDYTSTTASVAAGGTSNDYGALNRLTVTIRVRFTNVVEEEGSFSKTFTAFQDYDSTTLLTEAETTLIPLIVEQLADNIFQAAASNW